MSKLEEHFFFRWSQQLEIKKIFLNFYAGEKKKSLIIFEKNFPSLSNTQIVPKKF